MSDYIIVTFAGLYGGHWLALRRTDLRILKSSPDVRELCRWVRIWGESSLGKRGSGLSPRAAAALDTRGES